MVTISPSEPLLAEASWTVMRRSLGPKEAPKALLMHINGSFLETGDRGKVIAALLVLLARDKAILDRKTPEGVSPKGLKDDGFTKGRIVTLFEFADTLVPSEFRAAVRGL